jgi:regulator of sigma E protease
MIKILLGLIALGVVVFVHELGHFIAARLSGIDVETFSIGWGPVLFRKKIGRTEYRISLLPIGGYCGMKGERAFADALEKKLDAIPREEGSYYGAHPVKRIVTAFAGPAANLLFAVLALGIVSAVGYTFETYDNRIVPASSYESAKDMPIDKAGLIEGDRILKLGDKQVANFSDIQQFISVHPGETIPVVYERNGEKKSTFITPSLDKKTGGGKIGVYPWIPLTVGSVKKGSAAETAGIREGDEITAVDGKPVTHFVQFSAALSGKPEQVSITVKSGEVAREAKLVLVYKDSGLAETGISWKTEKVIVAGTGFFASVKNGFDETGKTLSLTVKSIGLLFRGVDLSEAVSGPVRITVMLGEVAQSSFMGAMELLSIICVSLFLMNLLPIPILDGGLILFAAIELVFRKPLKPKTLYRVQFIGIAFILFIFVFALFGDIKYLTK